MTDAHNDDEAPRYKPGQVVNGHILDEAGMEWLPLATGAMPVAPKRNGGPRTAVVVAILLGVVAMVGVAVAVVKPGETPEQSAAQQASPSVTQPEWLPAFDAWMGQLSDALDDWNDASTPVVDALLNPSLPAAAKRDVFYTYQTDLIAAKNELKALVKAPPPNVPEDVTDPLADLSFIYRDKITGIELTLEAQETGSTLKAEQAATATSSSNAQTRRVWIAMQDALENYYPPAEDLVFGVPPSR